MNLYPFKKVSMLGLDVQPQRIRFMQLKKLKSNYLIELAIQCDLPVEVFVDGKIKRWDILSDILADVVRVQGLSGMATTLCLPESVVRRQSMSLPIGMTPIEIEADIAARLHRELPGMTDTLCMDYVETPAAMSGYSAITFTVARQAYLSDYVACVRAAGLHVKVVDVEVEAIKRALCFRLPVAGLPHAVIAALYVLESQVRLMIFNQQENMCYQQWERNESGDLAHQIQRRLQSYLASQPHAYIDQLVVCGQSNLLTDLSRPLFFTNPFTHMTLSNQLDSKWMSNVAAEFLIAGGLAMREVTAW